MKKKIDLLFIFVFLTFGDVAYASDFDAISPTKMILQLALYLVVFVVVIIFALYGTKLVAKNFKGITSSKYTTLIDVMNIPGGTKITIVKINNKVYILAIMNNHLQVVDIVDAEDFPVYEENFDNYLSKFLNRNTNEDKTGKRFEDLFNKWNKEDKDNEK